MSETKVRWGVLSTSRFGRKAVIPAIQASRNGSVVAIASRDIARARDVAQASGIPRTHGSYEALLDDADIDAVYVPLPNGLHKEWSIRAAARGKHVLCEKPLALTAADCLEMQRAADANGVKLMEAFMYRFHPRTERAIELARSGALGDVRAIRGVFTFKLAGATDVRLDPALGGGALYDVGCYCVGFSRTVAAREPVEVQAWSTQTPSGVDARLTGVLRFDGGLVAHFDCALDMERRELIEIAGTDSSLTLDWAFVPSNDGCVMTELRANREVVHHEFAAVDQYQLMVEHFADCVLHNHPVRYDGAEAARNVAAIEALYESARTGRVVRLGA